MYRNVRVPILKFLIPYGAGIYLAQNVPFSLELLFSLLVPLALLIINRHLSLYSFCILGTLLFSWKTNVSQSVLNPLPFNTPMELSFHCQKLIKQTEDRAQIETLINQQPILLYVRKLDPFTIAPDDFFNCEGVKISQLDTLDRIFGNYQKYLHKKGIKGQIFLNISRQDRAAEGQSLPSLLYRFRSNSIQNCMKTGILSEESRGIFFALILGDKSYLERASKMAFQNSGVIHVLAISGLHVGIVFLFLKLLFIWGPKRTSLLQLLLTLLFLISYATLAGNSPSVLRASLMCILLQFASYREEQHSSLNLVFFTAFILLLFSPDLLFDIGFQLSFMAVISIVFYQPYLRNIKNKISRLQTWKNRPFEFCVDLTYLSLTAFLGTFPLLTYHFGVVQLGSIWNSVIIVPLITIIVLCGVLAVTLQWQEDLLSFLLKLDHFLIQGCNKIITTSNELGQITLTGSIEAPRLLTLYTLILFLSWPYLNWRRRLIRGTLGTAATLTMEPLGSILFSEIISYI